MCDRLDHGHVDTGPGSNSGTSGKTWTYQGRLDLNPPAAAEPLLDGGARLYSPGLGTFTGLDSVSGGVQDPLSMNRYLYAEANPSTFIDPTGHCTHYIDGYCSDHAAGGMTASQTAQRKAYYKRLAAAEKTERINNAKRAADTESAHEHHGRTAAQRARDTAVLAIMKQQQMAAAQQRKSAALRSNGDLSWSPPTLDQFKSMSPDEIMKEGPKALGWMNDHAFTSAILDNPSAFYVANQYAIWLERGMAIHPGDQGPSELAIDQGRYVTGEQYTSFASSPAVTGVILTFSPVGMSYAGASDSPNGFGSGRDFGGGGPRFFGSGGGTSGPIGEYFKGTGKAPRQVAPGTSRLEGTYITRNGAEQPWVAHYDEYGRMISRMDYNAGNAAAGIPNTHYHTWEYNEQFPLGVGTGNHLPGEYPG